MSLDLHIASSRRKAEKELAALSVDYPIHAALFSAVLSKPDRYAILIRMSDYYKDAAFEGNEVQDLLLEVRNASAIVDSGPALDFALCLAELCEQALARKLNVYAFSD